MPKPSATERLAALVLAACAAGAQAAPAKPLDFDSAFAVRQATSVHYRASFTGREGREQQLEAWRDGERRVRRVTDGAVETIAVRRPGDAEYSLTVLDRPRKLLTKVGRTSLYRMGNFTDWFDLAHALRHPKGEARVTPAQPPEGAPRTVAACRWFDLAQGATLPATTTHVCWSAQAQIPLAIVDGSGRTVWRVSQLELRRVPEAVFRVDEREWVVNDADRDMERD